MATFKHNKMQTYYESHGQGEPLILVAGYTCDHLFWQNILDKLSKYFQVIIFDNRGVGQTIDAGHTLHLEQMAEDTIALAQNLGLVRPHILGQSMGGAIAQIIARLYPDYINKLILLNSCAKFNLRTLMATASLLQLRKENVSFNCLVDACLPWFFSSDFLANQANITAFKQSLLDNPYLQSLQNQERQFKTLQTFDSRNWLDQIKAPTQIIAAEDDIVTLVSESQQLAENIPHADLAVIPGGHSSPIEQPEKLIDLIINFLKN